MYERFWTFTESLILSFMDQGIQAGINFTLDWVRGALMLLVVVAAVLLWKQRLDFWWVAKRFMLAFIVIQILDAGNYASYLREPFWTTIPNALAGAFTGTQVTVTAAQRFDKVADAATHVVALADAQASGILNFRAQFGIAFAHGLMMVFIGCCYALWLISRVATALLIMTGPFLLASFIFDATRGWGMGWLSKLVTLAVWTACVMALAEMMLAGSMMWVRQAAANAAGLSERLDGLWKLVVWFFINLAVMAGLPYYASVHSGAAGGVHAGANVAAGFAGAAAGRLAGAIGSLNRTLRGASGRGGKARA